MWPMNASACCRRSPEVSAMMRAARSRQASTKRVRPARVQPESGWSKRPRGAMSMSVPSTTSPSTSMAQSSSHIQYGRSIARQTWMPASHSRMGEVACTHSPGEPPCGVGQRKPETRPLAPDLRNLYAIISESFGGFPFPNDTGELFHGCRSRRALRVVCLPRSPNDPRGSANLFDVRDAALAEIHVLFETHLLRGAHRAFEVFGDELDEGLTAHHLVLNRLHDALGASKNSSSMFRSLDRARW